MTTHKDIHHALVVSLSDINMSHLALVGGKSASLGEMLQHLTKLGINVPGGYAITTNAYFAFLAENELDIKIEALLKKIKPGNVTALQKASQQIRQWILRAPFSPAFKEAVLKVYAKMKKPTVAIRSSATLEDLATASFAGAQETILNVHGDQAVLHAIKQVYASMFNARAISYRRDQDCDQSRVGLSVAIQPMVRSDKGASGVMFTLDPESGFDKVIIVSGAFGLGEAVVQGQVSPDEFIVYKPALIAHKFSILERRLGRKMVKTIYDTNRSSRKTIKTVPVSQKEQLSFCLSDDDVQQLARQALTIEKHYGKPMDIEWAKDGITGELYIVQARPETVRSQQHEHQVIETYELKKKGTPIIKGQSIGQRIGSGRAKLVLDHKKMHQVQPGDVLVTDMTDPDWEPVMKHAAAIITNRGGRTCHAAIIARELGIPAVVGCGDATTRVKNNQLVTVSCAEGQQGFVYAGKLPYAVKKTSIKNMPEIPLKVCLNIGNPDRAFETQFLPNAGVGLARLEFIISDMIGIHPNAALKHATLPKEIKAAILKRTAAYKNPVEYYIERLREGIAMIAAAFYPKEVIFRFSDFKSNEYGNLLGGQLFEPSEENPMIGFRGASRYCDERFCRAFELECKAFKRVREKMGLVNAAVMIPFVRTVDELREVIDLAASYGLKRGVHGLKIYMMCEIPSNVLLAEEFLHYVDGFSIGSNDLTQLTLGLDRDSSLVAKLFDERNEAVKMLLQRAIDACNLAGKYIGICGQGPSDHPDFARWLMNAGIQAISLNPDTVVDTWLRLAKIKHPIQSGS